jgi:serine/threonine protein kinase
MSAVMEAMRSNTPSPQRALRLDEDVILESESVPQASDMLKIHPAFQKLIEEAEKRDREMRELQESGAHVQSSESLSGKPPESSVVGLEQLLQDGAAVLEKGMSHDGPLWVDICVTPATLASALEPLLESDANPNELFHSISPFAEGRSGDVSIAIDSAIGSKVAVKVIPRDHERSADKVTRLPLEIHLMRSSRHENIVPYIGAYMTPNDVWIVTEFMDAGALADYLYEEDIAGLDLSTDAIAYVTQNIVSALDFLHSNHRMHRDVRSDNILLNSYGAVKLGDFGYATESDVPICDPVGTPYWMAPEMAGPAAAALASGEDQCANFSQSTSSYSNSVDVWALGVTLYEMAARSYPYAELDELEALKNIAAYGIPDPAAEAITLLTPSGLDFFHACTPMNPSKRVDAKALKLHEFLLTADMNAGRKRLLEVIQAVHS